LKTGLKIYIFWVIRLCHYHCLYPKSQALWILLIKIS